MVSRQHHWALFRPYSLIWLWTPSTPLPACYTGNSRFSCGAISTGTVIFQLYVQAPPCENSRQVRNRNAHPNRDCRHFAKHIPNYRGGLSENGPSWWTFLRKIRRWGLLEKVSLGVGFEVLEAQPCPVSFSASCLSNRCKQLLRRALPATTLPTRFTLTL